MTYGSTPFEDIVFAMMMYVDRTDVSVLKEYKMNFLLELISSRNSYYFPDTYDEYYEDIDEKLSEKSDGKFYEELNTYQDDKFSCYGILDDDDLSDYDELLK